MQGVSFRKGKHSFKGSDVDRKFSYGKLNAQLGEHSPVQEQRQEQVPQPSPTPVVTETGNTLAGSIASATGNAVSGVGDALSPVSGLFDILPNEAEEQPKQPQRRIIKKKKRKGQSPS